MISKEDIIVDMHTHTMASLHAYSTIEENMTYAEKVGLKYIAVTDHYFHNGDDVAKKHEILRIKYMENNINSYADVKIIGSAEFNILQDCEYRRKLEKLKWRPIGLHQSFVPGIHEMTYDDLYKGFEEASEWNNAFNHIERELDELCYGKFKDGLTAEAKDFLEKVVILAKNKNILLEINERSLGSHSKGYPDILRYWLNIAVQNGNRFYLGTDAHFCREVGHFEKCLEVLKEFGIEKDRVLNCNEDELVSYLLK